MNLKIGTKDPVVKTIFNERLTTRETTGFVLSKTDLSTTPEYVMKGAALSVDRSTRIAKLCTTGKVITGGTTTSPRISKGHFFKVGQHVMIAKAASAVTISAIDESNTSYDTFTFSAALSGATNGAVLIEAAAVGANADFKNTPNGLLSDNAKLKDRANVSVSNVIFALEIIEENLFHGMSTSIKTALGERYLFV